MFYFSSKSISRALFDEVRKYKILVVGDVGAGKTTFITKYSAATRLRFGHRNLHVDSDDPLQVQLWDLLGKI